MISVHYVKIDAPIDTGMFEDALQLLSEKDVTKLKKYKRWQDANLCLFGRLLIMVALERHGLRQRDIKCIENDVNNKPFMKGRPHFNISHSGQLVVCVMNDNSRIGIDVEKHEPINIWDFQDHFEQKEWDWIVGNENATREFYNFWTRKEAVIKADGRGLGIPLKDMNVMINQITVAGKHWYLKDIPLNDEYSCHLATEFGVNELTMVFFNPDTLLRKVGIKHALK